MRLVTGFLRLGQGSLCTPQLYAMMINLLWGSCIHLFLLWPIECVCVRVRVAARYIMFTCLHVVHYTVYMINDVLKHVGRV